MNKTGAVETNEFDARMAEVELEKEKLKATNEHDVAISELRFNWERECLERKMEFERFKVESEQRTERFSIIGRYASVVAGFVVLGVCYMFGATKNVELEKAELEIGRR